MALKTSRRSSTKSTGVFGSLEQWASQDPRASKGLTVSVPRAHRVSRARWEYLEALELPESPGPTVTPAALAATTEAPLGPLESEDSMDLWVPWDSLAQWDPVGATARTGGPALSAFPARKDPPARRSWVPWVCPAWLVCLACQGLQVRRGMMALQARGARLASRDLSANLEGTAPRVPLAQRVPPAPLVPRVLRVCRALRVHQDLQDLRGQEEGWGPLGQSANEDLRG